VKVIGVKVARTEALSGRHANWRAVQTKLLQLGFEDAKWRFAVEAMLRAAVNARADR
jgi:hypothetical protein